MDHIANQFSKENPDLAIVGLRFFNVYGSREYYKAKTSSMVIQLGHQILNGKAPRLFRGSDKILRDFINIEDVLQANIKACKPIKNGIYNVGTGNPRSFQDIADILQQELRTNLGTEYIPNPYDGYQLHTQADIRASKSNLGFDPVVSLEEGIKTYIPEIKLLHGADMS
jgi:ADP-L-glycero-D-manno-heptose 6-epimerase